MRVIEQETSLPWAEMLSKVAVLSVLWITGINLSFSCWQRQSTPEEKTLILVLFIHLGVMSCQVLINVFQNWKGYGYCVASAYCSVGGTHLNFKLGPKWCIFKMQTTRQSWLWPMPASICLVMPLKLSLPITQARFCLCRIFRKIPIPCKSWSLVYEIPLSEKTFSFCLLQLRLKMQIVL
jgi:hypothetical protein